MKRTKRNLYWLGSILAILVCIGNGCTNDPAQPGDTTPLPLPDSVYAYQVLIQNIHHIEPAERLVLWFKMAGDSQWTKADTLAFSTYGLYDSLKYRGTLPIKIDPANIMQAMVSIEPNGASTEPSAQLFAGSFDSTDNAADMSVNDQNGVGDYSEAAASATFTTVSADTNRAKSEFYIMSFVNGKATSSAVNMPEPPKGWVYSVWVVDSNFFPMHQFNYGSFVKATGPDSDSTADSYPFPGGYKPSPLNDPGATISVVLEPSFAVLGQQPAILSQFTVLSLTLGRFIDYNETRAFTNVWESTSPSARLILSK